MNAPGDCQTCGRTVVSYIMYEFFDAQIEEDGPGCPHCGAPDFRVEPPVLPVLKPFDQVLADLEDAPWVWNPAQRAFILPRALRLPKRQRRLARQKLRETT